MEELFGKSKVKEQPKELKFFLHKLRLFLRDSQSFNELKEEPEILENELLMATEMMVSDFNSTPPILDPYSLLNILSAQLTTPALYVAAAHTLAMRINWQERNRLDYNDGGRTASINDKAPSYKGTFQMFMGIGKPRFDAYKTAINLMSGYGRHAGIPSDYSFLDYYYDFNF